MWTTSYIISQILIVFTYLFFIVTYFQKKKSHVLITNIVAHIIQAISFILISGYTGLAMCVILTFRDTFIFFDEKNNYRKLIKIIFLSIYFLAIIISTIYTYDGFLSLLSVFATLISTYAVLQKKVMVYRLLGIPVSCLWLGYHIYIKSIFAIILESILLVSAITGYIKGRIKDK